MATTVKEMREQLSRFPDDAPVVVQYGFSTFDPLSIGQTEETGIHYAKGFGPVYLKISKATRREK